MSEENIMIESKLFDILKSIVEGYEEKLIDLYIDQLLRKTYPSVWAFSRFNLSEWK